MATTMTDDFIRFDGVLAFVDTPSDKVPSGARGHRVVLTKLAALEALQSLCGSTLKCSRGLSSHSNGEAIGLITHAEIAGKELKVSGVILPIFREIADSLIPHQHRLGMSYEITDATVSDVTEEDWVLKRVTFAGAVILFKDRAAYKNTSIRLWNN